MLMQHNSGGRERASDEARCRSPCAKELRFGNNTDRIRSMGSIRITSAGKPFDSAQLARRAVEVITTAAAMGLLRDVEIEHLDLPSFRRVVDRLAGAGIGTELSAALSLPSIGKDPG